jgi:RluA family pseudouridine synthase
VSQFLKLSSPATSEFWEIPILYEDERLLALDKPPGLPVSPDRRSPDRADLMGLLHRDLARGASWAKERRLAYLMNSHRLDSSMSGVLVLAKDKPTLVELAGQFGSEKPVKIFVALVRGGLPQANCHCDAPLAPHPVRPGYTRVDPKNGKRARTEFSARENFAGYVLLECRPLTERADQIRVHLKHLRFPLVGDDLYGGPPLMLSSLKPGYRLKPGRTEKPLISRLALHAEQLVIRRPDDGGSIVIQAPWPKDLTVAIKYLRRFAPAR